MLHGVACSRRLLRCCSSQNPQCTLSHLQGTLENAAEQLELYRNVLDNRVVSRFDAALGRQDLAAMADCARTMAQFRWWVGGQSVGVAGAPGCGNCMPASL
jgi:hypothetical protein